MTASIEMEFKILQSLSEVAPATWDALCDEDFPFAHHRFLSALEVSGCLGRRTGWGPVYLTAWSHNELTAALILYVKTNSYGEYIFDFAWAQAHDSLGIPYYPKLISAIPFTPTTGSKVLLKKDMDETTRAKIFSALLHKAKILIKDFSASSLHFLFIPHQDLPLYEKAGLFPRHSFQYHWHNQNWSSFEDFLQSLRSKRRREIRRERRQVTDKQINIQWLTGESLTAAHAETMYGFYQNTIQKMEGFNYLTADFFKEVFKTMSQNILLVLATDSEGKEVAGALNFMGSKTLFGRYWGCSEDYKSLHFEVCYYQGIDYCIQNKFMLFEPGAQGEHKFQRGFLPSLTYSAHSVENKRLDLAIQDFVEHEKNQIEFLFKDYDEHTPFSRNQEE